MSRRFSALLVPILGLIVLLGAVSPAASQQPRSRGTLWVEDASGRLHRWEGRDVSSTHRTPPAVVALAVESFAHSATGALSANELSMGNVLRAMGGYGVSPGEITLRPAFVETEYERPGPLDPVGRQARIAGFRAVRVLEICTERRDRVGLLVDLATGAGATRVLEVSTGE